MIKTFSLDSKSSNNKANKGELNEFVNPFTVLNQESIKNFNVAKYGTSDFHGLFKDMDLEDKKNEVMKIYKLIFRFSIEKLSTYLKDDSFFLIVT